LIFSGLPLSMHDLNERLLARKDLDLVCLQHLEGGPQAQLWISAGGRISESTGNLDTSLSDEERGVLNTGAWPIPNVLGVKRKAPNR
jgi:hypothetical protein